MWVKAFSRACRRMYSVTARLSFTGRVLAMQARDATPPHLNFRTPRPHLRDLTAFDENIQASIGSAGRVHNPGVLDQQVHRELLSVSLSPPTNRYRRAIPTATPLVTWSKITEKGPSATSGEIPTPRFIGPGCMMRTSGLALLRPSRFKPKNREYSRRVGKKPPPWRSS